MFFRFWQKLWRRLKAFFKFCRLFLVDRWQACRGRYRKAVLLQRAQRKMLALGPSLVAPMTITIGADGYGRLTTLPLDLKKGFLPGTITLIDTTTTSKAVCCCPYCDSTLLPRCATEAEKTPVLAAIREKQRRLRGQGA